jgi:cell division septation protein DedD
VREQVKARRGYPLPIAEGARPRDRYLAALPEAPSLPLPEWSVSAEGDWFVDLGSFAYEHAARRLVAMLRFQGPPIPALRRTRGEVFQVLAGPWPTRVQAAAAARRIARDLEARGQVVQLAETQPSARR